MCKTIFTGPYWLDMTMVGSALVFAKSPQSRAHTHGGVKATMLIGAGGTSSLDKSKLDIARFRPSDMVRVSPCSEQPPT